MPEFTHYKNPNCCDQLCEECDTYDCAQRGKTPNETEADRYGPISAH